MHKSIQNNIKKSRDLIYLYGYERRFQDDSDVIVVSRICNIK